MKRVLLLALGVTLLSTPVEAQSFLKKLGKAVEKAVKEEVSNAIKEGVNKNSQNNAEQSQQAAQPNNQVAQPATQAQSNNQATQATPALIQKPDHGENIKQESGLDYIDEYGINHGGGILIGGILWAPVNCGYHATDYPYGKLYQWGRKHGQGYGEPYAAEESKVNPDKTTAEIAPAPVTPAEARKHPNTFYAKSDYASFNWTENDMKLWNNFTDNGVVFRNNDNDPCPEGWRLPELFDFYNLVEHHSKFIKHPDTGQQGVWFSGPEPYSTDVPRIFLPAAGIRFQDARAAGRELYGKYWTLRHGGGEGMVWHLEFSGNGADVLPMAFPHEAYSVRCVKDIEGQIMK